MTQLWFKRPSHVFKWQITFYKSHFQKARQQMEVENEQQPVPPPDVAASSAIWCTWGKPCYEGWGPVQLLQLGPVPATVCPSFSWPLLKTQFNSAQSHKGTETRQIIIYQLDVRFFSEVFEPFRNLCYIFSELQVQFPGLTVNAFQILLDSKTRARTNAESLRNNSYLVTRGDIHTTRPLEFKRQTK